MVVWGGCPATSGLIGFLHRFREMVCRRSLYIGVIGFARIDTVFAGLSIARFVDPRRDAFFVVVLQLSFVSQMPRIAVHDVANDCDCEWYCKQPEHVPSEVTANACVHEIDWNAKQADDRN